MRLKLKRIALFTVFACLAAQAATAANVQDMSKVMTLLDRWEQMATPQGSDAAVWRDTMRIQLEQVSPATLDRLLAVGAGAKRQSLGEYYGTFIDTLGTDIQSRLDAERAQRRKTPRLAVEQRLAGDSSAPVGSSTSDLAATTPKTLGASTSDQVFTPITPCRVVDTRNLGGPIGAFATRNFFYFTSSAATNWNSIQGGVNGAAGTVCPGTVLAGFLPSSAVATITVTGQGGSGNLIVWQGTNPVASASTMSYPASGDTSSLATIPAGGRSGTGPGGTVQDFGVFVNAFSATNVVVDIVGYYSAPGATALDCATLSTSLAIPAGTTSPTIVDGPACAAGYTKVAQQCNVDGSLNAKLLVVDPALCAFNAPGAAGTGFSYSRCCRVPGH